MVVDPLICPRCRKAALDVSAQSIRCRSCAADFAYELGIPVLIDKEKFDVQNLNEDKEEKHQNEQGPIYDSNPTLRSFKVYWPIREFLQVVKKIPLHNDMKILELAGGLGWALSGYCLWASSKGFHPQFYLSDVSAWFLEKSSYFIEELKLNPAQVKRYAFDAENIPFEDGSLDMVIVNAAFHHFKETEKVIAEVARILKPGGTFLLVDEPFAADMLYPLVKPFHSGTQIADTWGVIEKLFKKREFLGMLAPHFNIRHIGLHEKLVARTKLKNLMLETLKRLPMTRGLISWIYSPLDILAVRRNPAQA
jgi:ubiquinone/menaquinone biosynthesis C-methylase UbiE